MTRLLGRSRVWGRGYTTIPVTVRRVLGIEDGDEIEWYLTDDGEVLIKKQEKVKGGGTGRG
ncbi:MAG: hypothetical protein DRN04_15065 [Thermoprotei archaeon]|nr:MAG: hypothetical protein DRN04_15065 [Thermoprotei archaeon]